MPVPDSYTEASFAEYLDKALAATAEVLGWTVANGDYSEIVNEALLVYGQADITLITGADNIKKLRAIGRVELWRAVLAATAGDYDFSADGGSYSRSLVHKMAQENLAKAEADASDYDPRYRVGIDTLSHKHDPYLYFPEDSRLA